jgi:hypothetical protein
MPNDISESDARLALRSVAQRRRQVLAQIDVPRWYWWGLAAGWIVLGYVTDLGHPWVTAAATLAFGAVHSSVAQRVLSGRHRSRLLSVRADLVPPWVPALIIGCLIGLGGVTIALALLAKADGADHPVTMAGVVVAVALVCGGPRLMAWVRNRSDRDVEE